MRVFILATTVVCLLGLESISRAAVPPNACNAIECPNEGTCFMCPDTAPNSTWQDDGWCNGSYCCPIPTGADCVGHCGLTQNSCFLSIECGDTCTNGTTCFNSVCCAPATCAQYAAEGVCGNLSDGCGGTLACDSPVGTACSSQNKIVACTHGSCPAQYHCGEIADGDCTGFLDCGSCPSGTVCANFTCVNPAPAMPADLTVGMASFFAVAGAVFLRRKKRA